MRSILNGRPQEKVDNHARDKPFDLAKDKPFGRAQDKPLAGQRRKDDYPTPGDYLLGLLLMMAAVPPATIIIFKLF